MAGGCSVDQAIAGLQRGSVIAYPTEAVWGMGCDPRDEAAQQRLLALKLRPTGIRNAPTGAGFRL